MLHKVVILILTKYVFLAVTLAATALEVHIWRVLAIIQTNVRFSLKPSSFAENSKFLSACLARNSF